MKMWDKEIARIAAHAPTIFRTKPDAILGVAVDDAAKRDYFVPRLQALLNERRWTGIIRIIPANRDKIIDLRAQP